MYSANHQPIIISTPNLAFSSINLIFFQDEDMNMKMHPNIFFFIIIIFFLLLLVSVAHLDMNCQVSSCGDIANISYPFWVRGKQPSYCGFPAFELQCEDDIPLIEMPTGYYRVNKIFYGNNSLIVANAELATSECPVIRSNLSFAGTSFAISPLVNRELYFLYNCSHVGPGPGPGYFKVGCATTGSVVYFVHLGGDYGGSHEYVNQSCSAAARMPVLGYPRADSSQYRTLLRNGFLLNYTVAGCEQCTASNGQCGYSNETNNFICICSDRLHWKSCSDSKSWKAIAIGASLGAAALIAVCCAVLCWCKRRKRVQQLGLSKLLSWSTCLKLSSTEDPELGESNYHTHIFSYDELQEATNGFDVSRELGDGGFGTVYKGKLRDGRTVAVKRLYENNYRRLQQFMNEVDILSRLRHQNLVTLYGCTSRHSRELLLVYEYIPNGTVADHLHGMLHDASAAGPLPWHSRISIAIETAEALAYLHAVEPQIIHRDVKSNNILLDNNFHVKVADFGLSRLFPLDATHVSTAPQGTPGYVDPEYHQCYQLTDKSDVYSFGVVLVELISSKPAVDISRTRHEINLASMAVSKIQKSELDQLVDPSLGYHSDLEVRRMITQVAELAFTCLQSDGDLRPSIKEVLEILRGIESGSYKVEKGRDKEEEEAAAEAAAQVLQLEETQLLKNHVVSPFSPDTVTERWQSRSTTPSNSKSG